MKRPSERRQLPVIKTWTTGRNDASPHGGDDDTLVIFCGSGTTGAINKLAREGWRLLPDYRFQPETGLWRHRPAAAEPPLRLQHVSYGPDGAMRYPRHDDRAPDTALAGYLAEARALFAALSTTDLDGPGDLVSPDFEHLRWFELPAGCLV